jgi:4-hydroxybenzoate polyprenyltransferase
VKTDLLIESLVALLKRNPLYMVAVVFWLCKGKAYLKRQIAQRVNLDVSTLPYHGDLLGALNVQRAQGRRLVLATAADEWLARRVADHLQLFDTVLSSDGLTNLSGIAKRDRLVTEFGAQGFDYAGNSRADLAVWSMARQAILVNAGWRLRSAAGRVANVTQVYEGCTAGLRSYGRALRLHQWFKNLILFVPLLAVQQGYMSVLLGQASLAFLAFGLCASSVYLLNDLLDLQDDRQHPRKRQRPYAAGDLPLMSGLILMPILLGLSYTICMSLPAAFFRVLAVYYALTLGYSFYFKKIAFVDVAVLAGLYTTRLIAGCAAAATWLPVWTLGAATLLFLSLALIKRYAELVSMRKAVGEQAKARSYRMQDLRLLAILGGGCGYVAVLAFALALYHANPVQMLNYRYQLSWLLCPFLFYWISHMWLRALRGGMHDDPVVFVLRDRVSHMVMACVVFTFVVTV